MGLHMQYVFTTSGLKYAFMLMLGLLLSACGGGGGGGGGGFLNGGGTGSTPTITIDARLVDDAGNAISNVTPLKVTVFEVKLKKNGQPAVGEVVKVTTDVGSIIPSSGSALTDANGLATFRLDPGVSNSAGTLTVSVQSTNDTQSINFQVSAEGLRLGRMDNGTFIDGQLKIGATTIPYGGSALVEVAIMGADGKLVDVPLPINFYSNCSQLQPAAAIVPSEVTSLAGKARFSYTATTCEGVDQIRATTTVAPGVQATGSLTVLSPSLAGIEPNGIVPANGQLSLRNQGSASLPEVGEVSFKVTNQGGGVAQGVEVLFVLSSTLGDIKLLNTSDITDSQGIATAKVQSGSVPTSFSVEGQIIVDGKTVSVFSDTLTVSTGLPDQNSFSLSIETFNVRGGDFDGTEDAVNIIAGDRFNNPVKDGTDIVFSTELGVIQADCSTTGGRCTVNWISGEPRSSTIPGGREQTINSVTCSVYGAAGPCPSPAGRSLGRRSTVMAVAVGEETFFDANGNGMYDSDEFFKDLPEPFLDFNEDGLYNPVQTPCDPATDGLTCALSAGETFTDTNQNGVWDPANGKYDGSACPLGATYCTRSPVHVRDKGVIVMSSSASNQYVALVNSAGGLVPPGTTLTAGSAYGIYVADRYNNMPIAGSQVTVGVENCVLSYGPAGKVPNTSAEGAYTTSFGLGVNSTNAAAISGVVTITVKDPQSNELIVRYPCSDPANPAPVPPGQVYTLVIEQLNPPYTTVSSNQFRVRVLQNGANVDGVMVSAASVLGSVAPPSVVTATGNGAIFNYSGATEGTDSFTATVTDPNVGAISQVVAFQVERIDVYLGVFNNATGDFAAGGAAYKNVTDPGNPVANGDTITVLVHAADSNAVAANPLQHSVDLSLTGICNGGAPVLGPFSVSTLGVTAEASANMTIPAGCLPININVSSTHPYIINTPFTVAPGLLP